jgi:large subunit ribosomal protein L14e
VQIGRVVRINYGPLTGKLATIVDIVNDKRVLIDGEGIPRSVIPITRLQLSKQVLKVGRGITTGKLRKAIAKENVQKNFEASSLGRSYASQARREQLNDFERFKVLVLRRKLSKLLRARPEKVAKKK